MYDPRAYITGKAKQVQVRMHDQLWNEIEAEIERLSKQRGSRVTKRAFLEVAIVNQLNNLTNNLNRSVFIDQLTEKVEGS